MTAPQTPEQETTELILRLVAKSTENTEDILTRILYSYGTGREIEAIKQQEQPLISLLRALPIAVIITPRSDHYTWQCLEEHGTTSQFLDAVSSGLHALIGQIATATREQEQ